MGMPAHVKIVEVGPRDGLQNESKIVPSEIKVEFINRLSDTGLSCIETTSFVSPKWIPQLADSHIVYKNIDKKNDISYSVLVPNLEGLENALRVGVKEIAVFTTPSELFSQKNTHCSVEESMARIAAIMQLAKQNQLRVRGYVSCVLGCPYQGEISPESVADLAEQLIQMGCYEVSLGDTIGVGTPLKARRMLETVLKKITIDAVAVHFHDTFGQALANLFVALECGVHIIDSSVSGLGGCPYAKGASGNVATEDVVYMLQGMDIECGVHLKKLLAAGRFISDYLQRRPQSKVAIAMNDGHSI